MKTLTDTLVIAQKQPLRRPAVGLVCRQYGHPQKAATIQWGMLGWELLYETDAISPFYHGVAIPADGSLNRTRSAPTSNVFHQRVASPGPSSDYTNWTGLLPCFNGSPHAIAARAAEVIVFATRGDGAAIDYKQSTDSGATFGAATSIAGSTGCMRAIAACHKTDTEMAIAWADSGAANLNLQKRNNLGNWLAPTAHGSPPDIAGLAMYYDGDYNIVALINTGASLRVARIVFGDGYRVAAGTWGDTQYLNLGRATLDQDQLVQQFLARLTPYSDFAQAAEEYRDFMLNLHKPSAGQLFYNIHLPESWETVAAILAARATDNLDVDAPFICKPASGGPVLSLYKLQDKWFFRLRPGTDFYDADWNKSFKLNGNCPYGLALAEDGTYLWGTRANEVWRALLPGDCWPTPAAGSGAAEGSVAIEQAEVLGLTELVRPMAASELYISLDNSAGAYSDLPTEHIRRGSRVELGYGYRPDKVGDETPGGNHYFLESWRYSRSPNRAAVTLYCIDAWGLLERYTIPGPAEFNLGSDDYTVYDLIGKLVQCIGGTLSYKSRSSDIVSLYPKLEVRPGESGAGVVRRLLALVPDVIYFSGLDAFIVYPQADDAPVYAFTFPEGV